MRRGITLRSIGTTLLLFLCIPSPAQELPKVSKVDLQPLSAHVKSLLSALEAAGAPLPETTREKLSAAIDIAQIQELLDPLCIAGVEINPESRVKVSAGPAKPELLESGWRVFLVKVANAAGVTAELKAVSPQAMPMPNAPPQQLSDRWLGMTLMTSRPFTPKLSGLELEYRIIELYSRDPGKRAATLSFNVGQGTQDLGFRNEVEILFTAAPAHEITFRVKDHDGQTAMASLLIKDRQGHVYPLPAKRLAPDFFFHNQVYRTDGESVKLPAGDYTIESTRGPEYIPSIQAVSVSAPRTVEVQLKRWIDPAKSNYFSGDHHIHAAGCAHYTKPTEGVLAKDMMRHVLGEDLKVGCNLTWGPCFDFQKQFFTGKDDPVSTGPYILRYDIEVSGFGSHRSGHLCLLRLKEQIYPGGDSKDHWPTLGLNTLKWAKKQGAICGPAHSGSGITVTDGQLPSYKIPAYNGIGANEFIVDITHEVEGPDGKMVPPIDFISTVDTDPRSELNMWYHSLNCGFRVRASGETDFPCIYGQRVGMGRSYVRQPKLAFDDWCEGLREGRNYVGDGFSHLLHFKVNDTEMGINGSELSAKAPFVGTVKFTAAARLTEKPDPNFTSAQRQPVWHLERARIDGTRNVKVEVIVNGYPVAERVITADGTPQDLSFDIKFDKSSWVAARIFPSSHTNPVFVLIGGQPIRASKRSAQWCLDGVDQCWKEKQKFYAPAEMNDAKAAYNHARKTYRQILSESAD